MSRTITQARAASCRVPVLRRAAVLHGAHELRIGSLPMRR